MSSRLVKPGIIMLCAFLLFVIGACGSATGEDFDQSLEALRAAALADIDAGTENINLTESVGTDKSDVRGTLNFFAMQICLLAVVLILHTYTGLHIIRRGIIFSDLVLDQLAAFGIVAGAALGIKYGTPLSYLSAFLATLAGCVMLALIKPRNRFIPREAIIGIMYGMALVACLLLADKLPTGETDMKNTLEGSMSWTSWSLVGVTAGVYIVLLIFHYIFRKKMIRFTDSKADSEGRRLWDFLFFLSQGIITILIVPVAGVLLAYGFLMIPAAIGVMFTRNWKYGLITGWASGMTACVIGIFVSYQTDSPYGPNLMLAMGAFFLVALLIRGIIPLANGDRS